MTMVWMQTIIMLRLTIGSRALKKTTKHKTTKKTGKCKLTLKLINVSKT